MRALNCLVAASLLVASLQTATAKDSEHWVVSWTGAVQGPYPVGNPSAQPEQKFAFPEPAAGARDQTFRLIVRPDIWGRQARIRLSNAFGTKPVTFDGVYVGLQSGSAALIRGSNIPVTFAGTASVTVSPGNSVWSDAIALPFAKRPADLAGRRLAVSFHVAGQSGPMTWHAKALTTSYVSAPGAGAKGALEDEASFPYATASWFFLDAIEMTAPADAFAIMAFGDSITDGTASTMNGDDRWPNVLSRRLKAVYGNKVAVVNGGIGGNQIAGPAEYGPDKPYAGGPASGQRLERDVLSLSGISSLIWLEGINDFSKNGNFTADQVIAAMKDRVARLRAKWPQARIIGATVVSALGSTSAAHGFPEQDDKRKALNAFIRSSGTFDGVIDFDRATLDPASGGLKPEFVPESTTGGAGDKLHPNRTGYLAMGQAIDLELFKPGKISRSAKQ
ncbi:MULTISPECIES: GDSL-type esterase/lipase family protein [unclassified Bradyrhizobium]|uniref:GDSL-type esterase/lipase family protein n=1 Tax=unclassified Bradyrhizobium TaxID=2631580 RepID=UPI001FF8C253|nr:MULTISPECIES: GDSL-type esterase/lipase family protein [unclassified Bradyrhizobium]MCK1533954.1 lysophospholipase [Bradyrhizobium sp. 176]MCK1561874.1 lysophospholipase [Bradyrhizobium sp. 171]